MSINLLIMNKKEKPSLDIKKDTNEIPDALKYPAEEDIYNKGIRAENKIVDENTDYETGYNGASSIQELNFRKKHESGELDVPGADQDDVSEEIGAEDEENNYYSLGGDNHENLEES